jgi:hypothetical protein
MNTVTVSRPSSKLGMGSSKGAPKRKRGRDKGLGEQADDTQWTAPVSRSRGLRMSESLVVVGRQAGGSQTGNSLQALAHAAGEAQQEQEQLQQEYQGSGLPPTERRGEGSWPAKQRVSQPTSSEGQWKWCAR